MASKEGCTIAQGLSPPCKLQTVLLRCGVVATGVVTVRITAATWEDIIIAELSDKIVYQLHCDSRHNFKLPFTISSPQKRVGYTGLSQSHVGPCPSTVHRQ